MYERILVPTDGSEEVETAISYAIDLAAEQGATIHTVYVINTASYGSLPMETSWEGISDMFKNEGNRAIARVEELATESDVPVQGALLEGTPSREIVRYAEEKDCDLVVIGTHGRGGIDRLLLGSVAERVVRTSPVPVLSIQVGDGEEILDELDAMEEAGDRPMDREQLAGRVRVLEDRDPTPEDENEP